MTKLTYLIIFVAVTLSLVLFLWASQGRVTHLAKYSDLLELLGAEMRLWINEGKKLPVNSDGQLDIEAMSIELRNRGDFSRHFLANLFIDKVVFDDFVFQKDEMIAVAICDPLNMRGRVIEEPGAILELKRDFSVSLRAIKPEEIRLLLQDFAGPFTENKKGTFLAR